MQVLIIGDTHCEENSLTECKSLFNLIYDSALHYKPDLVCFMGDDIDGHSRPSAKTQHFLFNELERLQKLVPIVILVGNHSSSLNDPDKHSLLPLQFLKNTTVIDKPVSKFGFDFMPFRRSQEQFIQEANSLPNEILFAHQACEGAEYENGWTEPNGFKLKDVNHKKIISGHIHKSSVMDKMWYVGSPRWLKKSDANEEKYIYLWNSEDDSHIKIPTWPAVQKMKSYEFSEGDVIPEFDELNTKYYVILKGNLQFCNKMATLISDKAEIKTILDKQKKSQIKRQSTVELSLREYLNNNYKLQSDISKEILIKEISERLK